SEPPVKLVQLVAGHAGWHRPKLHFSVAPQSLALTHCTQRFARALHLGLPGLVQSPSLRQTVHCPLVVLHSGPKGLLAQSPSSRQATQVAAPVLSVPQTPATESDPKQFESLRQVTHRSLATHTGWVLLQPLS